MVRTKLCSLDNQKIQNQTKPNLTCRDEVTLRPNGACLSCRKKTIDILESYSIGPKENKTWPRRLA